MSGNLSVQAKIRPAQVKSTLLKWTIAAMVFVIITVYVISGIVYWKLTHPPRRTLTTVPAAAGLQYEDITFTSRGDSLALKGWLIKSQGNNQTVIFAHGYGRNRLQDDVPLLPLAAALVDKGINIIMFDFRNSGESAGDITSVGLYEVNDLLGAFDFVQSRPDLNHNTSVCGFSMGAATSIMAGAREAGIAKVIADAPFADLNTYLSDNLSVWSNLPKFPFNHTILSIIPAISGMRPEAISPLNEVSRLNGRPLLLIHGEADTDIPLANSLKIQQRYPQAKLLSVPGAVHVGSFRINREKYIQTMLEFLQ
ncbi:MAG: alpha/beta hydrolase [Pelosinus sp.]|nr:alpha/beta hydrolase [Pelosinus sp.]